MTALNLFSMPNEILYSGIDKVTSNIINYNNHIVKIKEIHINSGTRKKRFFIGIPDNIIQNKRLIVACAGSNSYADGAKTLFTESLIDYQDLWPLRLSVDKGQAFIAIDAPMFGSYPYFPDNPIDPLVDDISCIVCALQYLPLINISVTRNLFVGGVSWGGIRATYLSAWVDNIDICYACGCQMSKRIDNRPVFNPVEWPENYDYEQMILNSNVEKYRLAFGEEDYMLKLDSREIIERISNDPSGKYSNIYYEGGHIINYQDLLNWI